MQAYLDAFLSTPKTWIMMLPSIFFNAGTRYIDRMIGDFSRSNFPDSSVAPYLAVGAGETLRQAYLINILGLESKLPAPSQGSQMILGKISY
jgi:hypothetical protein